MRSRLVKEKGYIQNGMVRSIRDKDWGLKENLAGAPQHNQENLQVGKGECCAKGCNNARSILLMLYACMLCIVVLCRQRTDCLLARRVFFVVVCWLAKPGIENNLTTRISEGVCV
jgi:hypothetical protein